MMNSKISTFRSALLVAALAFAPVTASLHAQMANRVQVNVPFDFQNGSEVLPAGVYTLTAGSHFLTIQGHNIGGLALSMVDDSGKTPTTGKVVFQRYGDKYFLREVWNPNQSTHTLCLKTSAETKAQKEAQSQIAATKAPTTVEIATK